MYRRFPSPPATIIAARSQASPAYFLGRPAERWLAALQRRSPPEFGERD